MVKTIQEELMQTKKELWEKKIELKRLKDIAFLVKDQINRLQVSFKNDYYIKTKLDMKLFLG